MRPCLELAASDGMAEESTDMRRGR